MSQLRGSLIKTLKTRTNVVHGLILLSSNEQKTIGSALDALIKFAWGRIRSRKIRCCSNSNFPFEIRDHVYSEPPKLTGTLDAHRNVLPDASRLASKHIAIHFISSARALCPDSNSEVKLNQLTVEFSLKNLPFRAR